MSPRGSPPQVVGTMWEMSPGSFSLPLLLEPFSFKGENIYLVPDCIALGFSDLDRPCLTTFPNLMAVAMVVLRCIPLLFDPENQSFLKNNIFFQEFIWQ